MAIQYAKLERMLTRCAEIRNEPDCKAPVRRVYDDRLKDLAETYLRTCGDYRSAESSWAKESGEALAALARLDQPYKLCRSMVLAYLPHQTLPETLKTLTTDTDRMKAIEALSDILTSNSSAEWAAEQIEGEFGQKAPAALLELDESIAANKVFSKAQNDRAAAFGPTWERYLSYKRVVRDAYGPKSKQYKRIHLRGAAVGVDEGEGGEGGGGEGGDTPSQ